MTNTTLSGPPYGPIGDDGNIIIVFWEYLPNTAAAIIFIAIFALLTLIHMGFMVKFRAWHFIPFILGGISETFGYFGRWQAHSSPRELGPWIMQNLLILAGAPLLSATLYMALPRLTTALSAAHNRRSRLRFVTPLYVLLDVAVIGLQLAGTVIPASGDPDATVMARNLVVGGLVLQVGALAVFFLMCLFAKKKWQRNDAEMAKGGFGEKTMPWKGYFVVVELATVLLTVRSIVRLVEFAQGSDGFVASHEAFIYILDAVPMAAIMVLFLVRHPGKLMRDMQ